MHKGDPHSDRFLRGWVLSPDIHFCSAFRSTPTIVLSRMHSMHLDNIKVENLLLSISP